MILRPTTAVNAVFKTSTVANINQAVTAPAAGDGVAIYADYKDDFNEQIYGGLTPDGGGTVADTYSSVTSIDVLMRSYEDGGSDDWVDVRLLIGGVWTSAVRQSQGSSYAWYTLSFSGSWAAADVDAAEIGLAVGSNPDIYVDVLYLDIDGVAGPPPSASMLPHTDWAGGFGSMWTGGFDG